MDSTKTRLLPSAGEGDGQPTVEQGHRRQAATKKGEWSFGVDSGRNFVLQHMKHPSESVTSVIHSHLLQFVMTTLMNVAQLSASESLLLQTKDMD
jgi:hypothetical protein